VLAVVVAAIAFSGSAAAWDGHGNSGNAPGQQKKQEAQQAAHGNSANAQGHVKQKHAKKTASSGAAASVHAKVKAKGRAKVKTHSSVHVQASVQAQASVQTQAPVKTKHSSTAGEKVLVCHKTGSAKNPYVVISISINGWNNGHSKHAQSRREPLRERRHDLDHDVHNDAVEHDHRLDDDHDVDVHGLDDHEHLDVLDHDQHVDQHVDQHHDDGLDHDDRLDDNHRIEHHEHGSGRRPRGSDRQAVGHVRKRRRPRDDRPHGDAGLAPVHRSAGVGTRARRPRPDRPRPRASQARPDDRHLGSSFAGRSSRPPRKPLRSVRRRVSDNPV
jgi:hypothetical protein